MPEIYSLVPQSCFGKLDTPGYVISTAFLGELLHKTFIAFYKFPAVRSFS